MLCAAQKEGALWIADVTCAIGPHFPHLTDSGVAATYHRNDLYL